ncbi:glycosyltransferase family 4 protein [Isoptericola sp. NPDC019482]|uniref:glycosyltransferase family 4 protein n=1 Tax=Isoptericola sp. NPDC019482 TaxID=3154688 RepID=UPI00347FD65E
MPSVALVASSFLPRVGGVEEHVRHLALALRDRGHRVAVWSVDRGDEPASLPGVPVRYLPAPLPASSPGALARFAAAAPRALADWRRAMHADAPDVVHVQCFGPNGPWATAVAGAARVPVVVGAHGETFMDAGRVFDTSRLQRRALSWSLNRAAAITACSRYAARDLARFGLSAAQVETVDVVGNGVDAREPVAAETPSWLPARYLLGLGRLVQVKGFDLLLRAYAVARERGTVDDDLHLVVAGDGPERPALAALAAELGLAGHVVLPGALARPDVVAVTARAEALVVPSRVEAFGIVVLEGLRAGIPVVATARGGASEIVNHDVDGLLVDPTDVDALADALATLRDAGIRERLGRAGLASAESWSWSSVADRVEAVYARVLS